MLVKNCPVTRAFSDESDQTLIDYANSIQHLRIVTLDEFASIAMSLNFDQSAVMWCMINFSGVPRDDVMKCIAKFDNRLFFYSFAIVYYNQFMYRKRPGPRWSDRI